MKTQSKDLEKGAEYRQLLVQAIHSWCGAAAFSLHTLTDQLRPFAWSGCRSVRAVCDTGVCWAPARTHLIARDDTQEARRIRILQFAATACPYDAIERVAVYSCWQSHHPCMASSDPAYLHAQLGVLFDPRPPMPPQRGEVSGCGGADHPAAHGLSWRYKTLGSSHLARLPDPPHQSERRPLFCAAAR